MASKKATRHDSPSADPAAKPLTAQEHYRREKQRRLVRKHDPALESAKQEYKARLEADAARQKGGRPKKATPPRQPSSDRRNTPE